MNRVETQCWVIPKRPVHLLLRYMGAGMVLYALLAVVADLLPEQGSTVLQATLGTWGMVAWATVGIGLLHEWYDGVAEGWLNPWLKTAVSCVPWYAFGDLCVRLFDFRLTDDSVQLSGSGALTTIASVLGVFVGGLVVVHLVVARATVRLHDTPGKVKACPTATES